jgi:hypothetical protein
VVRTRRSGPHRHRTVVVAVGPVWVVQVPGNDVVHMVAVRDGLVTAIRTVFVVLRMPAALVLGRALRRIRIIDREAMIVHVVPVNVVQMPVVEVIVMVAVFHGGVTAPRLVLMAVPLVYLTIALSCHRPTSAPVGVMLAVSATPAISAGRSGVPA